MKKILVVVSLLLAMVVFLAACSPAANSDTTASESDSTAAESDATVAQGSEADSEAETDDVDEDESSDEEVITLKFGHVNAEETSYHKGVMKFKEEVEKNSNGKIMVEVFPNSLLGNERDLIEGMQLGTVDCAFASTAPLGSFVPEYAILDAPFLYRDSAHAWATVDGEIGQWLNGLLLEKQGIRVMGYMNVGFRNIFSTTPVQTLDDIKGLKIRTMENQLHMATFNELGAQATPMAYGEVFTALQQNTIDAAENALQNVLNQKFYEAAKFVTKTGHFYNQAVIGISEQVYGTLTDEQKMILDEAAKVACQYQRELSEQDNQNAEAELKKLGVEVYDFDREALQAAVASVYDEFADVLPAEMIQKVKDIG